MYTTDDEDGAWPRCPNDGVLLREVVDGWQCAECTYREGVDPSIVHPGFGQDLLDFRRSA